MSRRLAALVIAAALSLVACDSTTPTTSPAATGTTGPVATAEPSAAVEVNDPAYLAGDVFSLPMDDEGMNWLTPSTAPVMPNGQPAVRVAFLPASCATGNFMVQVDRGPPEDTWEAGLREASEASDPSSASSWPAAQAPECADGQGRTYLELGYHPLDVPTLHLVADLRNVTDAPTEIELVPVYTSADASQPSLTMPSVISLEPRSGPKKPREATPVEVASSPFTRTTLPDGSAPDQWGFRLTGCRTEGPSYVDITAQIGSAEPVDVGKCSEGTFAVVHMSWPLPAEGTPIAVLMAGGTTKSYVQVAEFQWRGDRD